MNETNNKPKKLEFTPSGIRYIDAYEWYYPTDLKQYCDENVRKFKFYVDVWERNEIFRADEIKKFRDMIDQVETLNSQYFVFEKA